MTPVTVRVEVPVPPVIVTADGPAATVKSCTLYDTVVVWLICELVAVTVTAYVPAEPEQLSVLVADDTSDRLESDKVQVKPVPGETDTVSATVPANPSTLVRVSADGPATPASTVASKGLAAMLKSCIVTPIVTV